MTNLPHCGAPAFIDAHLTLMDMGAQKVYDPAVEMLRCGRKVLEARTHDEWVELSLRELNRGYDMLVMMPGWDGSPGAKAEFDEAVRLGIPCVGLWEVCS
jgi:hypothetical protein